MVKNLLSKILIVAVFSTGTIFCLETLIRKFYFVKDIDSDLLLLSRPILWGLIAAGIIVVLIMLEITKSIVARKNTQYTNKNKESEQAVIDRLDVSSPGGDFNHLSIFDNFNLGILCVDNEGFIIRTNEEFCRKTGFTEHDLIGNKAIDILGEKDMSESDTIRNRKAGRSEIYEHSIRHKDGKNGRYYTAGMPLFDQFKKAAGSIGVILDVSDMHEYQEQLKKSLEAEKKLNESKSHFVATASHQFRTPLSIIQSNAELIYMILKKTNAKEKDQFYVFTDRIKRQITHMAEIMGEVLILEKITTGKLKLNKSKKLIEEIFIDLKENLKLNDKGNIEIKIKGKKREAYFDVKLIHESLTNLVTNALKYSFEESPIVEIEYKKKEMIIKVCDSGVGIPSDEIDNLFEPFFRASNVSKIEGTGLGLNISKQYIEMHEGKLSIESAENEGTTAIINLPYGTEA